MKNKKNLFLYVFLVIGIQIISNRLLEYDTILSNSLSDQLTQEQLLDYLRFRKDLEWVGYIVMPIILFIKLSMIAAIIDVGCFFFEKEIKYKKLFNIVVKAEFVFLGVILLKTEWFLFFMPNYTLEDLGTILKRK
jgi:hypothetical protein